MANTSTESLSAAEVRWVIGLAARAPSVHNTQPWRYEWDGHCFRLLADTQRGLLVSDPDGRELAISCGASLFNLRVALRHVDRVGVVTLLPDSKNPRILASVEVVGGTPLVGTERRQLMALQRRHTRRGAFNALALTPAVSIDLIHAADAEGGELLYVTEPGAIASVLKLARAGERSASAPAVREETEQWTPGPDSARRDGVPARAYPAGVHVQTESDLPIRDFDLGRGFGTAEGEQVAVGPLAVLVTDGDLEVDWLRAGQALQAVLVTAAESWAFASLHSRVCEVPNLRSELRRQLGTAAYPHLLMQFGHAETVAPTPRRAADDIIDLGV
jgi:hypothetical protein